jgi:hypothetical protein
VNFASVSRKRYRGFFQQITIAQSQEKRRHRHDTAAAANGRSELFLTDAAS